MTRTIVAVVGWLMGALLFAVGLASEATGWSPFGASHEQAVTALLIGGVVFVGVTAWREVERIVQSHPDVRFSKFSPYDQMVTMTNDRLQESAHAAHFERVAFINCASRPEGDRSTAHQVAADVILTREDRTQVDRWYGRWADLDEAEHPSQKRVLDCIDLPANRQPVTLDLVMQLQGVPGSHKWDNERFRRTSLTVLQEDTYMINVALRGIDLSVRHFKFRLHNATTPDEQIWLEYVAGSRLVGD